MTEGQGPLAGLKVLDLSNTAAGAQASLTLADFGAEVVYVEPPGGSILRATPSFPFVTRGKRSVVLDLGDDTDRGTARVLALGADVLIESFRPGKIERFGLGYDDLRADNPGLVYGSVTAWGRTGPYAGAKGYEQLVMARIGACSIGGDMVTRPGPGHVSVPYASYGASQLLLTGILGALHERERSGLGQRVDTSLVKGVAALGTWNWYLNVVTSKFPEAFTPSKAMSPEGVPLSPLMFMLLIGLSKDGRWLQFSQAQPHLYLSMLKAFGLDWMVEDEEWKLAVWAMDPDKVVAYWEQLVDAVATKTVEEWQAYFETDHDVWAETMRRGSELLDHKQMQHLGAVVELDDDERGTVRQPGPIVRLSATPAELGRGAPALDADGGAVRSDPWPAVGGRAGDGDSGDAGAAFADVTLLELGTFFAAPFGGTVLRELGARVIKVEPLAGEPMRTILPFPEVGAAKSLQGKESIAVDIATEEGLAIVHQLAARADVVLQSFRAGKAHGHGVDAAALQALNPDLVYLNAPGYGIDGPCGDRPAFAPTIGAGSGIVMRNIGASVPEEPGLPNAQVRATAMRLMAAGTTEYAQADGISALTCASAMALGLLIRDRTGTAQELLTTMLTSASHLLADDMTEHEGREGTLTADADLFGYSATYRLYDTADGWVYLAAPMAREWDGLAAAVAEQVDLGGDPRFADAASRVANDAALAESLAIAFKAKSAQEWEDQLLAADVGCVVAHLEAPERVLQSAEFGAASGLLVGVEHPTFGEHDRLAPLVEYSRSATVAEPGVLCGQHTTAILGELGYDAAAIADLRARNIVG
jgi:crotonobetainyl-CoA:carnitine CoA-transferase CaiB-like acyl-CoA transferase